MHQLREQKVHGITHACPFRLAHFLCLFWTIFQEGPDSLSSSSECFSTEVASTVSPRPAFIEIVDESSSLFRGPDSLLSLEDAVHDSGVCSI